MGDTGGAGTGPGGDGGTGPGRLTQAFGTVMERLGDSALLAWVPIPNTPAATLAGWATKDRDGGWTVWSGRTRAAVAGFSPSPRGRERARTKALRDTEIRLYVMAQGHAPPTRPQHG
jgi:hypothetical protein